MSERKFETVFGGLDLLVEELKNESLLFSTLNHDLKEELQKAKVFNQKMAGIALVSLALGVVSLIISIIFLLA